MPRLIAPSMLSADFGNLDRDCRRVNRSAAGWFHLDVMDGIFVPNISFGFPVCKAIAAVAEKPLDAHLMIVEPWRYIERFAQLGVKYLSVHYEACGDRHLKECIKLIRENGMGAGVAINPETPAEVLIPYLRSIDYVVVMGVHPGYSGQKYIPETTEKVAVLAEMIASAEADCFIEVDGGVNVENIAELERLGAGVFVAGSAAFSSGDPKAAVRALLDA
ncbi:MAG: ribulose-phosphate 3-epimerase [Bacteroidales bacterium]|nr:ribulose-phosphate 3-epimerase [Bacteroidales bacterium]MBQ1708230.1 ribulose-phosphate 3-epimerase [Bacteroidales bacterium]MBQ2598745.1 ribulose-phosphate 3-epimerase [Bacteroidales bacterium]MBQ4012381.1 ribulose-phosphate 3-epimerase [Bacteroidales bacterium]